MAERKQPSREAPGRKYTSLALDPALYKRAQHYAVDHSRKVSEVLNEALEEYLKKRGA